MSTPSPSADRNLIFGLLALQMDFVSREQLLDAMHAWMLAKDHSLGEILCRRGVLEEEDRSDLDRLVNKHIKRHGGEPQASLAALHVGPEVREDLSRLDDADVQASLISLPRDASPHTRQSAADESVASPATGEPIAFTPTVLRFRRLREHARGGLGEVFVALDGELNREVALKEIQDRFADHPDSRARFLREAEITGNLEHPGVVPIYGLGAYPDGRPYYAMRFIRGESMHEAIHRFHKEDRRPGVHASERSLALRELLGRFVAVCNALAYAHARGVIHRDLKPANVMLGEYGETLVVDWGLARLIDRPDGEQPTGERLVTTGTNSGTAPTQMGEVVGTPAFMPPEQAEGRLDRIGIASDVFALGATLYALLTGQPPYHGDDLLGQARRAEAVPARQRKRSVPAALEAVCARAMARRPEDRYATARALADDVQRWLADEQVSAYREPLIEQVRRLAKRHRTLATALAVLLLTTTVALGIGLIAVKAEEKRTRAAKQETDKALVSETAALERSRAAETSASRQRQLALQTIRRVTSDIHAQLKDRPGHKELRKALLARALDGLKEVARAADTAEQVDHATIWAHFELGDIFLQIEESGTVEAKKQYEKANDLARQRLDTDPSSAQAQRDLSASYERLGNVHLQLGDSKAALADYQKFLEVAERLAKADPSSAQAQRNLFVSYSKLGDVHLELGDSKAALADFQKGLEVAERLARADPRSAQAQRDLAVSYERLGDVHLNLGDSKAALADYQKSLQLRERLIKVDPSSVQAQRNLSVGYSKLGDVHLQRGDSKAALADFQKFLEVAERLAKADPSSALAQRDLLISYSKLGDVHLQRGDSKAALADYQKGLELLERLARADPRSAQAQRDLAVSYERLGDVHLNLGDSKAALADYQKSLQLRERLARADPSSAQAQRDLFVSDIKLGDVHVALGDSKAALADFQKSLEVSERLAKADPSSVQAQRDLSIIYDRLGDVHLQLGESRAALADYQKSLELVERLIKVDPSSVQAQRNLSVGYSKLGDVHLQRGDSKAALADYQKSLEVAERLAKTDPSSALAQRNLLASCFKIGNLEQKAGQYGKAADWYARALDIPKRFPRPDFFKQEVRELESRLRFCRAAEAALADPAAALEQPKELRPAVLSAVAAVLARQKKADKALAAADLLAANAQEAGHLYNAACTYALCVPLAGTAEAKEKRAIHAVALLRQAVAKGFKDAAHMKKDTDLGALRGRDDFKKLLAELDAAERKKTKER